MRPSTSIPPKLVTWPALVGLVVVIVLVLGFLYQNASQIFPANQAAQDLKNQLANRWQADFQQMLRDDNAKPEQVLQLAEQLSTSGYWSESAQLLASKMLDPQFAQVDIRKLAELRLQNSLNAYYVANEKKAEDSVDKLLEVRKQLQVLGDLKPVDATKLQALAKQSVDFNLWEQAAKLYAQLAATDPKQAGDSWSQAAKWASQAGDDAGAEGYWAKALQSATTEDEKKLYQYAWMEQALKVGQSEAIATQLGKAALEENYYADEDLTKLATISQQLTQPELTSQLYARLAQRDKANQQKWLEKAAYWAMQAGLPTKAAPLLEQAVAVANVPTENHALKVRLLDTWMQAKQPVKALAVAKQLLDPQNPDTGLLDKSIQTAIAAKAVPEARDWNKQYIALHPQEAESLLRQADIEYLAKDYTQALAYTKEAVRLDPENVALRERWAYLAERAGDRQVAMDLWDWLYKRTGKAKYQRNRIYLAQASMHPANGGNASGLDSLIQQAQEQPLPTKTIASVFSVLTKKSAEDAEHFMLNYLTQHAIPDLTLWKYLADWQVGQKRLAQAQATWEQYETKFGPNNAARLAKLQVLWELKQTDKAKELVAQLDTQALQELTPYQLEILAELSWQAKDYVKAQDYYTRLVASINAKTPAATSSAYYQRLAATQKEQGDDPGALSTLQQAWQLTQNPTVLLDAVQLALEAQQMAKAQDLLQLAQPRAAEFDLQARYWLLRGQLALAQQQPEQAKAYYQHLLLVETTAGPLRQQALLQSLDLAQKDDDPTEFNKLFAELEASNLDAKQHARVYEIALARALAKQDNAALNEIYAKAKNQQITLSSWLQLAVVLQQQDKPAIKQLLQTNQDLTVADRVAALVALGRNSEAYNEARQAVKAAKTEEERQRAQALALSLADGHLSSVQAQVKMQHLDRLNVQEQSLTYHQGQTNDGLPLQYTLQAAHSRLSGEAADGTSNETRVHADVQWQNATQQVNAGAGLNQRAGKTALEANLDYRQQLTPTVAVTAGYGYQEIPTENAWLRANGQRKQLRVGAEAKLSEANLAQASLWQSDFAAVKTGQALTTAQGGRVSLTHQGQLDTKQNWYAGVQGSLEKYKANNHLTQEQQGLLPDDTRGLALVAGLNQGSPGSTNLPPENKDLRYSLNASLGKQWPTSETTRRVEAALGKRISTADELSINTFYDKSGTTNKNYGLFMQYKKWFDVLDDNSTATR